AIQNKLLTVTEVYQILNLQAGSTTLFGQIAMEFGFLEEDDVNNLLAQQQKSTKPIGEILVELGALTRDQLTTELTAFQSMTAQPAKLTSSSARRAKLRALVSGCAGSAKN